VLKKNLKDVISAFATAKTQKEMERAMMGMFNIFTPTFQ